jgi:lipopolysaccharide transport system ATP-binding protein
MSDYCISVEHLTKKYRLGTPGASPDGLRHRLEKRVRRLFSFAKTAGSNVSRQDGYDFLALQDVSFQVKTGDVLGVIGRNGAGKSTLLKILSRIVPPTEGQIQGEGRIASLLEVGTGFHPDLTGRENTFLNGAILGMRRSEIKRKYDEIVAFAEVEKFIDTPVRRYSSGMYVRLAFAVAAHLEPDILIVDEVLAVGDSSFQKKCIEKMENISRSGRTILLVSHQMAPIRKLCKRVIVLQKGQLVLDSAPTAAVAYYMGTDNPVGGRLNLSKRLFPWYGIEVVNGWMENHGIETDTFLFDDAPLLVLEVDVHEELTFSVELVLRQADAIAVAFAPSGLAQDWEIAGKCGRMRIYAQFPPLRLARGTYSLDVILTEPGVRCFDQLESTLTFSMAGSAIGKRHWDFSQATGKGCLLLDIGYRSETVPVSDSVPKPNAGVVDAPEEP